MLQKIRSSSKQEVHLLFHTRSEVSSYQNEDCEIHCKPEFTPKDS